jgi:hypothetical protein
MNPSPENSLISSTIPKPPPFAREIGKMDLRVMIFDF